MIHPSARLPNVPNTLKTFEIPEALGHTAVGEDQEQGQKLGEERGILQGEKEQGKRQAKAR